MGKAFIYFQNILSAKGYYSWPHSKTFSKHEWLEVWSFNHSLLLSLGPSQLGIEKCTQIGPKELMVKISTPELHNAGEI